MKASTFTDAHKRMIKSCCAVFRGSFPTDSGKEPGFSQVYQLTTHPCQPIDREEVWPQGYMI